MVVFISPCRAPYLQRNPLHRGDGPCASSAFGEEIVVPFVWVALPKSNLPSSRFPVRSPDFLEQLHKGPMISV